MFKKKTRFVFLLLLLNGALISHAQNPKEIDRIGWGRTENEDFFVDRDGIVYLGSDEEKSDYEDPEMAKEAFKLMKKFVRKNYVPQDKTKDPGRMAHCYVRLYEGDKVYFYSWKDNGEIHNLSERQLDFLRSFWNVLMTFV